MAKKIQIFRTGTHKSLKGDVLDFSEGTVSAVAVNYNPDLHEAPLVIGHPTTDAPAFGWVKGLEFADGVLSAEPHQINADFAELVKNGAYKKISASFYPPQAANNPVPGQYYLRHVGFLGAAAPAVKGLRPAEFADDEDVITVEFSDVSDSALARLMRGLRDFFIDEFGQEKADKALSPWDVNYLQETAAKEDEQKHASSFADPATPEPKEDNMKTAEQIAAERAELENGVKGLEDGKAKLDADRAAFAEQQAKKQCETAIDTLVAAGKVLPAERAALVQFASQLDGEEAVEFADVDGKKTSRDYLLGFLDGLPKRVDFSERTAAEESGQAAVNFAAPDGMVVNPDKAEIHAKALAHQSANKGVTYIEAVKAVSPNQ